MTWQGAECKVQQQPGNMQIGQNESDINALRGHFMFPNIFFPYNSLLCIIIYTGIWYDAILFSLLHNLWILTNYIKGTQLCHSLHVQVKYTIKIYAASIGNRKSNWNKEVNIVCMHFCHSCMLTKEPVWKMHKLQSSNQFVTSTSTCVVHWIIFFKSIIFHIVRLR